VVIFSLRMYAQQVFSALFTGVSNTIACVCRRGVSGIFPPGLRLAFVSSVRDLFGHGKCLPIFYRELMCMCCMRVCMHTHTYCMWGIRMWAQVSGRDTWRARKKSRCTVVIVHIYTVRCTKYTCMYTCWATGRSLDPLPFGFLLTRFSFHEKDKKKMWANPPIFQIYNRFGRIDPQSRVLNHFDDDDCFYYYKKLFSTLDWGSMRSNLF